MSNIVERYREWQEGSAVERECFKGIIDSISPVLNAYNWSSGNRIDCIH